MKYVQINAYSGAWADSIIFKKHRELLAEGNESWVFWARGDHKQDEYMQKISSTLEVCFDAFQTRLDGKAAFHSKGVTKRLLNKLDAIDPDFVHLHVLLGYYVNVDMLFNWLANHHCQVIWTLHDCWSFTGHCYYFTYAKCEQWKTGCDCQYPCPQIHEYPETIARGSTKWNFENKKRLFTMLPRERMKLIVPSQWLANLVRQSFMAKYEIEVVHNTVNTDIFKPTPSDFRKRYGIGNRFMVLGVASKWSDRKGLHDFLKLAHQLDSERFAIVLIGLTEKQIKKAKDQLVALPRTENMTELAEACTAADVLINPSVEEAYGMTVAEAAACDTKSVFVENPACIESGDKPIAVSFVLSDLKSTIVELAGGGRVILMSKTGDCSHLAAVYTAADVFFNPTLEDNYPTVNLEAEACSTPVVTYNVGGSSETISLGESVSVQSLAEAMNYILLNSGSNYAK